MHDFDNKKFGAKQWRQQKGSDSEFSFDKFCKERNISCTRLEQDEIARKKFLKDSNGKCPDFHCSNKGIQIFVEIKTHTLLTNEARDKEMARVILAKKSTGLSGTTIFGPFDPRPELKAVFEKYLRNASSKFKNIKEGCNFPRILLLNSHHANEFDIQAIFWGAYPSFYQGGGYAGLKKMHRGLFESTGSNVSAVIYWNEELNRFEGRGNPKAITPFEDEDFKKFFEISND